MKKTLLALAAVAAMGVASAQVTLGGSIAVAVYVGSIRYIRS